MKPKNNLTSGDILKLLKAKHAGDVIVDECKNGKSWGRDLRRLDAWVLKRTWAPITAIGYEIKVSRHDFEQDQKWIEYTDYCNEFYFVCPAGLIRAGDLPSGVGLIWTTMSGTRLQTKIKATHRKPDSEKLSLLMNYVIMARSVIVQDMYEANNPPVVKDRVQMLADLVKEAESRQNLCSLVRGNIRNSLEAMRKRAEDAERKEKRVADFERRLAMLGITWDSKVDYWNHDQEVRKEIDLLGSQIDSNTLYAMKNLGATLQRVASDIEEQRARLVKKAEAINREEGVAAW